MYLAKTQAIRRFGMFLSAAVLLLSAATAGAEFSIARQWNEELLAAIRVDFARPTVHARNLWHLSIAMWDAWAAYSDTAQTYLHHEKRQAVDHASARAEAISYACYRILQARFAGSPGAAQSLASFDAQMDALGYDRAAGRLCTGAGRVLGRRSELRDPTRTLVCDRQLCLRSSADLKRIAGSGPLLGDLEWDAKLYFALGGAMHDAAVSA
jgi:hypothetical protein